MATRLKVTLVGERQTTHFIIRHFHIDDLTSPATQHLVIQLHFTSWPHHTVPDQCLPLLQVKPQHRINFTFFFIRVFCSFTVPTFVAGKKPPRH